MLSRLCISQLMISLMYVFSRITGVSAHIPFLYLRVAGVCVGPFTLLGTKVILTK